MRQQTRRTPIPILTKIHQLAEVNPNAAAIRRELEASYPAADVPSERTIRDVVNEKRVPEPTAADSWSPVKAEPGEAVLVMPVLQAVIEETGGTRSQLTTEQASTIARIRSAAPDLPLWSAYVLGNAYTSADRRGASTAGLDLLIAFGPWRGPADRDRYWRAVNAGAPRLPVVDAILIVPDLFTSSEAPLRVEPVGRGQWVLKPQPAPTPRKKTKRRPARSKPGRVASR